MSIPFTPTTMRTRASGAPSTNRCRNRQPRLPHAEAWSRFNSKLGSFISPSNKSDAQKFRSPHSGRWPLVLAGPQRMFDVSKEGRNLLAAQPKKTLAERMPWSKSPKTTNPNRTPTRSASLRLGRPNTLTQTGRVTKRVDSALAWFFYDEKSRSGPGRGERSSFTLRTKQNSGPAVNPQ